MDRVEQRPETAQAPARRGPSAATVRTTLFVSVLVLGVAALVYVLRYLLLVINRNTLLNSVVAGAADWLGVAASAAAIVALIACVVVLTRWLIARRAAAFSHYALPEHRSAAALWAGCLVPFANLLWAPVYVIELAAIENHYARLQRPILLWWIAWVFSYVVSIFAFTSSFATDSQGIANNTVMMVFAYLFTAVAVASIARVFEGFERKPVHRPAHRWLVMSPDGPAAPGSAAPVELDGQEPAA
jgi:branched-subunit amino acid transport protein